MAPGGDAVAGPQLVEQCVEEFADSCVEAVFGQDVAQDVVVHPTV